MLLAVGRAEADAVTPAGTHVQFRQQHRVRLAGPNQALSACGSVHARQTFSQATG
jgi:hypothetical protein